MIETDFISFSDLKGIVSRNMRLVLLLMVLCGLCGYIAQKYLPKKYKSKAVLNIQSGYFQNALLGDLFSSVSDPAEQSAQRQSLLRYALNEKFIDGLAEKYHIYKYPSSHPMHVVERETFQKKLEYYPISATSFQISVTASESQAAYEMTKAVLAQMIKTLVDERRKEFVRIKNAVESHVQALSVALKDVSDPVATFQPESLKGELEKINGEIKALKNQYTEMHPGIQKLEDRARTIRSILGRSSEQQKTVRTLVSPASKGATQEVFNDLVKKLNYLSVVSQMEGEGDNVPYLAIIEQPTMPSYPIFPNRTMVALISFGSWILLSAVICGFSELKRGSFLSPEIAARHLGTILLGELPRNVSRSKLRLIEGPGENAVIRYLPQPAEHHLEREEGFV